MKNYHLVPVTFAVSGMLKVYDQDTLEDANRSVSEVPENFAPVDAVGRLSFSELEDLQYVDGSLEVSYTEAEELRAHKLMTLMDAIYEKEEAIVNVKDFTVYIPDVSIEPYCFHGFSVKTLKNDEIKEAISYDESYPICHYCLGKFPAAGTCAPDRLGWIPCEGKEDAESFVVRAEILDFLNNLPDEDIDAMMTESEFVSWWKRKNSKNTETLEVEKVLVLSTSHVTESTAEMLDKGECSCVVVSRDTGWFINIVMLHTEHNGDGDGDDISEYPEDLKACIKLAQASNCEWLLLDRDGPVEEEKLPVYDW